MPCSARYDTIHLGLGRPEPRLPVCVIAALNILYPPHLLPPPTWPRVEYSTNPQHPEVQMRDGFMGDAVNMYKFYKLTPWRSPLEANVYFWGQEIPSCSQTVTSTGPFAWLINPSVTLGGLNLNYYPRWRNFAFKFPKTHSWPYVAQRLAACVSLKFHMAERGWWFVRNCRRSIHCPGVGGLRGIEGLYGAQSLVFKG
jgi:hypothetical protein